jgi:hypothetical protein
MQFSKHYSELRHKSWTSGKVVARRFGFSREKKAAMPIYVVRLKSGQVAKAVYEEEMKWKPRI